MTTKILTGTYASGYTLAAGFTGLQLGSTAGVLGPNGADYYTGGGVGLTVPYAVQVSNSASLIAGGTGHIGENLGGKTKSSSGTDGGDAVRLTGGTFSNAGSIAGGAGGAGAIGYGGGNGGNGGIGISLGAGGEIDSSARITGGAGGAGGGGTFAGAGGVGGAGLALSAGGVVVNSASIHGGQGGAGGGRENKFVGSSGAGGAGGVGVSLTTAGTIQNNASGSIYGGDGGSGGLGAAGGAGGAGVWLAAGGAVINKDVIHGGAGGASANGGDALYFGADGSVTNYFDSLIVGGQGGASAHAGVGVQLFDRGTVTNAGIIQGGYNGQGFSGAGVIFGFRGSLNNTGVIYGGATTLGTPAVGVQMETGYIYNGNFIRGGLVSGSHGAVGVYLDGGTLTNGGSLHPSAFIYGSDGVVGGGYSAVTVVNAGTLSGFYWSVFFANAHDRLIVEAGSVFEGPVAGQGTLELASGADTITGMGGGAVTLSGTTPMLMSGFSSYQVDVAASLTLTGANTVKTTGALISEDALSLALGATLTVSYGAAAQVQDTLANQGTITLATGATNADLRVLAGGASLTGGGTVAMSGAKSRIIGATAAATLTNVDNTIVGAGVIGANQLSLVNQSKGIIDATGASGLAIATKGETLINQGLMEATGGGILSITSTTIANLGGTILATNVSPVKLQTAVVRGGSIVATGSGVIKFNVSGGELDGTTSAVSLSGVAFIVNGSNETLAGSIANAGKINLIASTSTSDLIIGAAGATLSGGGQVNMTNSLSNRIYGLASGDTLTNVDNRIDGAGVLGNGTMTLINDAKGQIVGNQNFALTIDTGVNTITNAGLIENVGKGGTLVKSAVNNTGTLLAATAGTLNLAGAVTGAGVGQINGGTLYAQKAYAEKVTFTGTTGVLELGDSQAFTGTVVGLSKTGTDWLDLVDIGFFSTKTKATFSGTTASGTLVVTDGTHTAHISLIGNYIASTWTVSGDGHGGTKVVDPSGAAAPLAQAIAGMRRPAPAGFAEPAVFVASRASPFVARL